MRIEKITFGQWKNAYRCTLGDMSLVAVADVGPRILSFGLNGGPNILFTDGNDCYRRGDWHLYGGHRFWAGPETEHAFAPENACCEVRIDDNAMSIVQPVDGMGLQKELRIQSSAKDKVFVLDHIVRNVGKLLFPACIWTLTCALPHCVVVPWASGSSSWQCNMVRYWRRWDNHSTDPGSEQWKPDIDRFVVEPSGEEGKIGLYSEYGFLALLRPDSTFVKTYKPLLEATYSDGGCNVELYTCKDFVELETLSPMYTFYPGREYCHTEQWLLVPQRFEPAEWKMIQSLLLTEVSNFK